MARPRGNTALFDLLREDSTGAVASGAPSSLVADRESSGPVSSDRPLVLGDHRLGNGPAGLTSAERAADPKTRPLVDIADRYAIVSLTSARMAVIVFVLAVGVLGSFEWGRRQGGASGFTRGFDAGRASYAADTMSEIEAARRGPVSPGVVEGLTVGGAGAALTAYERAVAKPTHDEGVALWIPGHTYIVAQGFSAGRDADAAQAQAFLSSRGVETVLVQFDSGAIQLITSQGFNRSDKAQRALADHLLEEIHKAGSEYFASGGGYRLEGYFATFKGDRW